MASNLLSIDDQPHWIVDSPIHHNISLEDEEEEENKTNTNIMKSGILEEDTKGRITPLVHLELLHVPDVNSEPAAARKIPMDSHKSNNHAGAGSNLLDMVDIMEETIGAGASQFPEEGSIFDDQTWANLMTENDIPTPEEPLKDNTSYPLPAGTDANISVDPEVCSEVVTSETKDSEEFKGDSDRRNKRPGPQTAPQRPLSAYNLFFRDFRRKILEKRGQPLPFAELGKEVGKTWKGLPKKERKHWEDLSEVDSERYQKEVKEMRAEIRAKRRRATLENREQAARGADSALLANTFETPARAGMIVPASTANHSGHQGFPQALSHQAATPYAREVQSSMLDAENFPQDLPPSGTIIHWPEAQTGAITPHTLQWKVFSVKAGHVSHFMEHMRASQSTACCGPPGAAAGPQCMAPPLPFYPANHAPVYHPVQHSSQQPLPHFGSPYPPLHHPHAPPMMGYQHPPQHHALPVLPLHGPPQPQPHWASHQGVHHGQPAQYTQAPGPCVHHEQPANHCRPM